MQFRARLKNGEKIKFEDCINVRLEERDGEQMLEILTPGDEGGTVRHFLLLREAKSLFMY